MYYTESRYGSVRCSTVKGTAILGILEGYKHRSILLLLKKNLPLFIIDSGTASFCGTSSLPSLLHDVVTKVLHRNYIFQFVHVHLCSLQEFLYFKDRQIYLHFLD